MVTLQQVKPLQIETESFRIIEQEFPEQTGHRPDEYGPGRFKVIQRVIHATGDFSFAANLFFHERAIQAGLGAIRAGRNILIDVNMGAAGISRSILDRFGGKVICRIGDEEVGQIAKTKGLTRSEVAFEQATGDNIGIVAIGNAPTALLAAMRLIEEGKFNPDLVIGVPVGFVNAQESKEILSGKAYPFITALGRKGGTPVAVAIINALLRLAEEEEVFLNEQRSGGTAVMERTFAIVKPDAFAAGNAGKIIARIYSEGFKIVGLKKLFLSKVEAQGFYDVHRERPFFGELTDFMSSGPCIVMVLEAENAIKKWRDLMGATNPASAAEGTLRRQFGSSVGENATHGSDAPETAAFEMGYFFSGLELL